MPHLRVAVFIREIKGLSHRPLCPWRDEQVRVDQPIPEMCSGSEARSYLRFIDCVYHPRLGLRVTQQKQKGNQSAGLRKGSMKRKEEVKGKGAGGAWANDESVPATQQHQRKSNAKQSARVHACPPDLFFRLHPTAWTRGQQALDLFTWTTLTEHPATYTLYPTPYTHDPTHPNRFFGCNRYPTT